MEQGRVRHMRRWTLHLPVMIAAAVLVACSAASLVALSEKAESTFPGKNGRIAFVSTRATKTEDGGDIYTMNPKGTAVRRLTNHPERDFEPAWSPDGDKIAFQSNRAGKEHIYTVNQNGTRVERLTDSSKGGAQPNWSPNGSKIAFVSNGGDIYTMNADGTRVKRLTDSSKADFDPAWSPNGNRIAFVRDLHGKKPCRVLFSCNEIYTMISDGTGLERLTNNRVADFDPDWQPLSLPETWPSR